MLNIWHRFCLRNIHRRIRTLALMQMELKEHAEDVGVEIHRLLILKAQRERKMFEVN